MLVGRLLARLVRIGVCGVLGVCRVLGMLGDDLCHAARDLLAEVDVQELVGAYAGAC